MEEVECDGWFEQVRRQSHVVEWHRFLVEAVKQTEQAGCDKRKAEASPCSLHTVAFVPIQQPPHLVSLGAVLQRRIKVPAHDNQVWIARQNEHFHEDFIG